MFNWRNPFRPKIEKVSLEAPPISSETTDTPALPEPSIDNSEIVASFKIEVATNTLKPCVKYFALLGREFEIWGIVEIVGDTRSLMAFDDCSAEIIERIGASYQTYRPFAVERKLAIAHTKGFNLPPNYAVEAITELSENLQSYRKEMEDRLSEAAPDYHEDKKGFRELTKETYTEFLSYWKDEIRAFRKQVLPEREVDFWETQISDAEQALERAQRGRAQALLKQKT